ncbi:MAG: hypothetical protein JXM71_07220, partial [Spirochaetales bacterium]|nr:hypothetical protein [Spirochaetales bacterium]
EEERVKMAPCVTYDVPSDKKMALFRSVLETYRARPVAVFCDVRGTAEETAKALRASGMRVEYILGALPRKKAIFDSVRSGAYEVLVLTDEGADGLPAAWAPLLVNWDLPLEGEPYLQRLSHLATTSPDSHVFNFACERYSYGIPAIERVLGASLAVVQPDSSVQASVPSPRPAPPAGQKGVGDDRSGGDRRDRGGQYDGRNARSIQANIAAITGGAVFREPEKKDKPEAVAREKRGRTGPSAKKKKNARQAAESPRAATNGTARGEARKPPAGTEAHSAPRKGSARPRRGSGGRSGAGKLADPYSVSMEERLRLYRERYGSRVDGPQERPPKGAPKGSPKGARRGDRNDAAAKPSAPESKDDSSPRSGGLAGAIRSLFGKKDD